MTEKTSKRYEERGVSSAKEDVHHALKKIDKGLYPGAFCKIIPDLLGLDPDFCNIMHADGAGTKSSLAYLYWKETGDLTVWKGIAQDAVIMNTEDILCIGALGPALISSTIGRNKFKIPGDIIKALIEGTEETLEMLGRYGMKIYSTGGETADLGDLVRTIIVDSTLTTRMPRKEVIDNAQIQEGDCIVGLSSSGKAVYENEYNGGMGSNGLSSARHDILQSLYSKLYPESYDQDMPLHLAYSGSKNLLDFMEIEFPSPLENRIKKISTTIGKLILSPTRTYVPILAPFIQKNRNHIHGMVHCSGGGQTKILHFIKDLHIIKDSLFTPPPLFELIQKESGSSLREMYSVFNMGHRMEVYLPQSLSQELIELSHSLDVEAKIIGRVEKSDTGKKLSIQTPNTLLEY
jgi:phosphoribosylformylglycinamidine cyclo-ligase